MSVKHIAPQDFTLNELQNWVFQSLSADPTGVEARPYWNSSTKDLRLYNGTTWISLLSAVLGGDLTAIEALSGTGLARRTGVDTWALDSSAYLTANQTITFTGDATGSGTTAVTLTIPNNTISNAKLADMATMTIKGNNTGSTADPIDLTVSQTKTMLALENVTNTSDANKPVSTAQQTALDLKANLSLVGAANGIAGLDSGGKVPTAQLPSYVDDVIEVANYAALPGTGVTGIIYVTIDTNYTYRWTGSVYVRVGAAALTADEALKWTTPRNIAMTGDGAWNVTIDGTGNVTAAMTLAASGATAGTYGGNATQVMTYSVDAKGRITSAGTLVTITPAWSSITSKPTTVATSGLTDAVRYYKAAIAGGATSEVITHNLGTRDIIVQLIRVASPYDHVECEIESTTTNTATLRYGASPSAGEYRVVIMG